MIMRIKEAAAIEFCNNERTHMSINMMTPSETAQYTGKIKKSVDQLQAYRYKK